ncbi:uncharacterized protein RAG0_04637 [Rhynchosporium agropyri]|uniref:Uncharacterized protein n=1 Tax=Rhynchosporium agropyri TaxID=914238 RepID=A0A1E1KA26_9HELO|nr:uncharacterized protein RAG0_04637 [Rhynchosporium agropyri]
MDELGIDGGVGEMYADSFTCTFELDSKAINEMACPVPGSGGMRRNSRLRISGIRRAIHVQNVVTERELEVDASEYLYDAFEEGKVRGQVCRTSKIAGELRWTSEAEAVRRDSRITLVQILHTVLFYVLTEGLTIEFPQPPNVLM